MPSPFGYGIQELPLKARSLKYRERAFFISAPGSNDEMSEQEELEAAEKATKEKEEADKKAAEEKLKAEEEAKKQKEKDFEVWISKQPENVRNLYDEHIGGLKSALEKERDVNKTNKGALDKLSKFEEAEKQRKEAEMTETEKLKVRAETAEAQTAKLLLEKQRGEVAAKVGLPAILADRIKGETPEEMEEDAKQMLTVIPKQKLNVSTTNPGQNALGQQETNAERAKRLGLY